MTDLLVELMQEAETKAQKPVVGGLADQHTLQLIASESLGDKIAPISQINMLVIQGRTIQTIPQEYMNVNGCVILLAV